MFDRKIFKKKPTYLPPRNISTNNLIDPKKKRKTFEGGNIFGTLWRPRCYYVNILF